jgi:Mg/Co/Ni transporter MgtE
VHIGSVALSDLVRAEPAAAVESLADAGRPAVGAEADLPDVAMLMTDYNLIAMPVLDGDGRPVGMVAVDDVLERLLPEEWRRRSAVS